MIEDEKKPKRKKAEKECYPEANRQSLNVLAIDPSYNECGFSIFLQGNLHQIERLNFKQVEKQNKKKLTKKEKRTLLAAVIKDYVNAFYIDLIVTERTRLFSQGFISIDVIAALSELIVTMIDAVEIMVVSIGTQSWKKASSGSARHKKEDTMEWVQTILTENVCYDTTRALTNDECDAVGIGYAFYNGAKSEIEQ